MLKSFARVAALAAALIVPQAIASIPKPPVVGANDKVQRAWQVDVQADGIAQDKAVAMLTKQVGQLEKQIKVLQAQIDALRLPATQPAPPTAARTIARAVYCDEVAHLRNDAFDDPAGLPAKLKGKAIALIDYEPNSLAAWLAADDDFARWIDAVHAIAPSMPVGVYSWPIVTCTGSDPEIKAAMLRMTKTAARVDYLAPDSSQSELTAGPGCARLQMASIHVMFPDKPRVAVIKHRIYPSLQIVSDAEIAKHLAGAFDGADAAILWDFDIYFEATRRSNDPTAQADRENAERVFSAEIPFGVDTQAWLEWIKQRAMCIARQALLGSPCILGEQGLVREDGRDVTLANATILSDSNGLFLAPVKTVSLNNVTITIAPGQRSNQYAARIACDAITALHCIFDNAWPAAEAEACLRLVSCTSGGTFTGCRFIGGRVVLDGGGGDEWPGVSTVAGVTFTGCTFDIDAAAPQVMTAYAGCRKITFDGCDWIIPDGKGLAAIDPAATITFNANRISRDHGLTWRPVENSIRDFKRQDAGNPGVTVSNPN